MTHFKFLIEGPGQNMVTKRPLELVYGANFEGDLHHFSRPTRLDGSRGEVWPELGLKPKIQIIMFITYTKRC